MYVPWIHRSLSLCSTHQHSSRWNISEQICILMYSSEVVVLKVMEHLEGLKNAVPVKHSWEELCYNYILLVLVTKEEEQQIEY